MDLPFSLTMVTDASTPSATLIVTGASTVTPTAPSVTEEVSLGTNRSANGVPLSKITFAGAAVWLLLQATPTTANTIMAATSHDRCRRKGVIKRLSNLIPLILVTADPE